MIAKSTVIKDRGGKSGGRAAKAVGLTSGGLRCVSASGLSVAARRPDRSAEVSRGHSRRERPPKARTVEEASRAAISREPCGRRIRSS